MRDRLIKLIKEAKKQTKNANCDIERNMIFADYLLKNGVIVPLSKIGDIVYQTDGIRIYDLVILNVFFYKNSLIYATESVDFDERAIGKTVFLTREEAEQALKGGEA